MIEGRRQRVAALPAIALPRALRNRLARLAWCVAALGLFGAVAVGLVLPKGLGAVSNPRDLGFFLVAGAAAGIGFLRPRFAVVATVASFVFSGFLRRVLPAANPAVDIAAVVPLLVALPLAFWGLRARKPLNVALLLLWISLVGARFLLDSPLVSIAGWLNFALPLAAAFGVADIDDGIPLFARTVVLCAAAAATYGMAQYFIPFRWDVRWLANAHVVSIGRFGTPDFRPFGTLPAPVTAAALSAVVLLLLLFKRELVGLGKAAQTWAFSSCTLLLLLTQVRGVWISFTAALLVGVVTSPGRRLRRLAVPIAGVIAFLVLSPQADVVVNRARTLTSLQSDVSFNARRNLLAQTGTLASPLGRGLGSLSAGSRAETDASIDNGFVVVLGEAGMVGLGIMAWVLIATATRMGRDDRPFFALIIVSNMTGFLFGNLPGLLLWTLCGATRKLVGAEGKPAADPPAPVTIDA